MTSDISRQKAALRRTVLDQLSAMADRDVYGALRAHFLDRFAAGGPLAIAGFHPVPGEPDVLPLLSALDDMGWPCCLPVVETRDVPMVFRRWQQGAPLAPGAFGIPEPLASAGSLTPDIVLVPLVAYGPDGQRLGRGAGFYDRTLAELRSGGPVLAVGVAFTVQRLAFVPEQGHDQRLDAVLTEAGFEVFEREDQ